MTALLLVLALLTPPHASFTPVARFTVTCPQLQCTLDASASTGGIARYSWTANGKTESHAYPVTKLSFPAPGLYDITLRVTDSTGHYRTLTKKGVAVPSVPSPPPVRVDTLWRLRVDTLRDTIAYRVTLPSLLPTRSALHVDSTWTGQGIRVFRVCYLGMGHPNADKTIAIFPTLVWTSTPSGPESIGMRSQSGSRPSLVSAAAALDSAGGCPK